MFKKCDVCQKSVGKKDNYCKKCGAMLQLKGKKSKKNIESDDAQKNVDIFDNRPIELRDCFVKMNFTEEMIVKLELLLKTNEEISISKLQRYLTIGFLKAWKLFDILLEYGYVIFKENDLKTNKAKYIVNQDAIKESKISK